MKAHFGAQPFEVVEVECIKGEDGPGSDYGLADIGNGIIRIRADLATAQKASTVCHEAEHVMLQMAGMKAKGDFFASDREEEQFVCRMEHLRHAFIVQNVELILWMWQVNGIGLEEIERLYHAAQAEQLGAGS